MPRMTTSDGQQVRLAPPGAGLPWWQALPMRYFVGPIVSTRVQLPAVRAAYGAATADILGKTSATPPERRHVPVLVSPTIGLEDSSRNWSLNGVLEHLLMVSRLIEAAILNLARGIPLQGRGDPAKVKPRGVADDLLDEFTRYAPGLYDRIDRAVADEKLSLESTLTFPHAWFGPLNARQWYWLLSRHQQIHRVQVRKIVAGLGAR